MSSATFGMLGWLLRKPIEHWFARDLEAKKAGYARELEAYRTSLIVEAEATKASQEVRKSAALMYAQKEFEGLHTLHTLVIGSSTDFLAAAEASFENNAQMDSDRFRHLVVRSLHLAEALDRTRMFLADMDQATIILNLAHGLGTLRNSLFVERKATRAASSEEWKEIIDLEVAAREVIDGHFRRIRLME